jgi:hypothetical protein
MTAELPKIEHILGVLSVAALACAQEPFIDVKELSNENLVELYVTAVLEKYENNLKFFEEELLERRLFLVALEWFDYKKSFLKHTLAIKK